MITNVAELKAELIARHIAYEDEMCGCSEQEILEIEAIYGKLPQSYRQIIGLIGHSAGFLIGDISFYVSTDEDIDQIIAENEYILEVQEECIENNDMEAGDELLDIPKNRFFIDAWSNNFYFVLTESKKRQEDSPIYVYDESGKIRKEISSVWKWMDGIVTTSFNGDRGNTYPFWLAHYRKPRHTNSGKIIIQEGYKNPDIVKQFINSEESRQWYENRKND